MMRPILAALLLTLTPAAGFAAGDEHSDHLSEVSGVRVLHAWTRATDEDHAKVFLEIENTSDAEVTLTGGEADIAGDVHLQAMDFKNPGTVIEIEALPVPAKSEFALTPTSVFLELHDLSVTLSKGDEFEMHIELAPLGEVEIHVEVEASDADNHSHAGHNH